MTTLAESSPETSDTETLCADVFEGPEKKLEVYFSRGDDSSGLRRFQHDVWSDMLADAACTILHQESNKDFDAYLLSESSMFVYPDRLILKTCGTTTLLLALPKVRLQPLLLPLLSASQALGLGEAPPAASAPPLELGIPGHPAAYARVANMVSAQWP